MKKTRPYHASKPLFSNRNARFRIIRHSCKKIVLYVLIFFLLGISNVLIKLVSFKKLVRIISNASMATKTVLTQKKRSRINTVKHSLQLVSKHTPWRSMCFEQALTASFMLKMLGISHSIYFGLNNDNNELKAHAWLLVNDSFVTGFNTDMNFAAVSAFFYTSKKDKVNYV